MVSRLAEYLDYHRAMIETGDMDPALPALRYVAQRFELNPEQRHWLAFLYACSYCAGTAFSMYNEFPDFECLSQDRLARWWAANKARTIFQTDRLWVKSRDQFPPMVESYRRFLGGMTQQLRFDLLRGGTPEATYRRTYVEAGRIFQMGRFALFLYTEALAVVAGRELRPDTLDLRHAESCRNGLCYALGRDDLVTGDVIGIGLRVRLSDAEHRLLQHDFDRVLMPAARAADARSHVWNVETSLCAFKKHHRGLADPAYRRSPRWRWVGYYLDRHHDEVRKLERLVPDGVCWDVLWEFRRETFEARHLKENRACRSSPSASGASRPPARAGSSGT